MTSGQFLSKVYNLSRDEATDLIFNFIDEKLTNNEFDIVDEIIKKVDIGKLSTSNMRSFLVITLVAKNHLSERAELFKRIFKEVEKHRGLAKAKRLLDTLK